MCPGVTSALRSLFKSEVRMYRRSSQVQLIRGEFLKTALYWAGVASVGAIAEKKVSQQSCVWGFSVGYTASPLVVSCGG